MAKGQNLIFVDSEIVKQKIMDEQKKEIAALYQQWADDIGKKAEYYAHKGTASAPLQSAQLKELQRMLNETSKQVSLEIEKKIAENIYTVADAVVADNVKWLKSLGFNTGGVDMAFSSVPDSIVRRMVTGNIYASGWSLSKRIWSDNQQVMKDAYRIVAGGVAENRPIYDIAKDLERYISPSARKAWNPVIAMKNTRTGKIEYKRIYKGKVDYSAQRLARTLVQHGYQQSFIETTKDNPFVTDYIWRSNGSRVCELCASRDGKHFPKDKLPMDHPNGMCTMEPGIADDYQKSISDWLSSPSGTYPEIDTFAEKFGYKAEASFTPIQQKYLSPYGFGPGNMPKDFDDWSHKVSYEDAASILKEMGTSWADPHPYQKMKQYFDEYLVPASGQPGSAPHVQLSKQEHATIASGAEFAAKYGTSSGATFNYWYTKLDPEAKKIASALKNQSGQTWQQWYESNIYVPKPGAKPSAAQSNKQSASQVADHTKHTGSLSDWIARVKSQTERHMLDTERDSFSKMNSSQVNGVKRYTGSSYTEMNAYLRYVASGMSHKDAMAKARLDKGTYNSMVNAISGLKTASTSEEFYLRRGTDLGDLAGLMQGDFSTNKRKLEEMSVSELNNMFAGHVGTYAGFTSTSSIWDRGFYGSVEVIFRAPVGTQGTSIMTVSQYGTGEGEFLLNAGTRIQVVSVEESDGHSGSKIRVYMDIIGAGK